MPPPSPENAHATDRRNAAGDDCGLVGSGTEGDKAAGSQCFQHRPYTRLRVLRAMVLGVDLRVGEQTPQRIVLLVQHRDAQRLVLRPRRLIQPRLQRRVLHTACNLAEQLADILVLRVPDIRPALILRGRQGQHHADEAHLPLRERRAVLGDAAHQARQAELQDGRDFGAHAAPPSFWASTMLWNASVYQPLNALIGSVLRPSAYSRAAEIQIAAPFRLAKISHQWSAFGSAFSPLAFSQIASASSRGSIPPTIGAPPDHKGSIAQPRSSSGSPRCDISQSRIARISPFASYRKFPVR